MKWLTDDEFFGTELVESGALIMGSAIAQNSLSSLATTPDFLAKMQVAFGNSFDVEKAVKLASAWARGDFSEFPEIEIRSEAEINGALGAFAAATGKIYLSREFLAKNAGNVTAVAGVLLEEFGHFVDSQINRVDAIGDEGEIFSDLVQGKALSQGELAALKGEDDSAIVVLDGELRAIEQAKEKQTLDFFANNITLKKIEVSALSQLNDFLEQQFKKSFTLPLNLGPGRATIPLATGPAALLANVGFDYNLQGSLALFPFIELSATIGGATTFSYPLDLEVERPNAVSNAQEFSIKLPYQIGKLSIDGQGVKLPDGGLKVKHSLDNFSIENFSLANTPFGSLVTLPQNIGINFSGSGEKTSTLLSLSAKPGESLKAIQDILKATVSLPETKNFQPPKVLSSDNPNSLPIVKATSTDGQSLLKLETDADNLLVEAIALIPEFKPLYEGFKKALAAIPFASIKPKGLGFSIKIPKDDDRKNFELTLDLLAATINAELGLEQSFAFKPKDDKVRVTMTVDQGLVDGRTTSKKSLEKSLEEPFNFTAPSQGSGIMKIQAKYELIGEITNEIDALFKGNFGLEALKGSVAGNIGFFKKDKNPNEDKTPNKDDESQIAKLGGSGKVKEFSLNDLLKLPKKTPDLKLTQVPIAGPPGPYPDPNEPKTPLPLKFDNPFKFKVDPIKVDPTNQNDDLGQEDVSKNLVIETTYEIPYNMPVTISDVTVDEGNNPPPGEGKAYFTYNGKYYEWESRTVERFTGPTGDILSRIALETLGDGSPDAYNFIAFHNNIANPDLIFTGSTIEFPKEVQKPDTTGYAVFELEQSGTPNTPVKINYNTNDGTAKAGSDYKATSGKLSIPASQGGVILVPIVGDEQKEKPPTENFTVVLTKQDGTPFGDGVDKLEGTGTIIDDDEKPEPPKNGGQTYNDPRIITIDKQYHDFQGAGEFTLIESTTGDLKIQVRQQPINNNPRSNVADNTAVATVLGGKRIGIYKGQGLLIDGQPTQIANDDALAIGGGRIYREGSKYTIVYPTGDQLVASVGSRVNIEVFLKDEREGKVKGLLGNFNKNPKDDLVKRDGTVLTGSVSQQQLYGEYADSWRVSQAESLFDYKAGENTNTFTLKNYPRQKVKISDLTPADVAKAEQLIGDRIKNPTTREAAIIDLVLTDFDPDILEEALNAPDPDSILAIALPFTANSDFTTTTVNTATKIDILANDTTAKDPLSIKEFNTKSFAGGIITLDNNNTPDDKTDDKLTYTPPPDFTGTDKFNYLLTDGQQIQAATVTININSLKLDNLSGNNGFVLNGTEAGNFSGVAVSKTGDINGDKIDDIIVGAFGADPNNINAAGKSQVIFGTQKFPASVNLSQLNGQNGFTLNGTDAEGFSGGSVSNAGDINGDGIKDFIIGAFGAAVNGQNNAGKTYIVFGTNKGFPANFNLANLNGNNGFAVTGTNTFDYAGLFATGIGDINGDRTDDVLISAPGPLGGTPGKSYVIYGRTTGFSPNFNLAEINSNNGFVINGIDGNSSGTASSGDINGDGIPDLVIGADGGTTNGGINAGKTYVIFGQQGGFNGSVNVPELNGTTGFVIAGLNAEERSGIALTATGDINGDGNKDIVIGSPGATVGDQINAGKISVIFGKKEEFSVILNPAELNGNNGFTIFGFDAEGSAGNAVSYAGDVNKDGFDDLLIGASSANSNDQNNAGKTFIVFGSKEFPANFSLAEANGKNALVLNGVETDGLVGTAVSGGGDINGDGIDDLIVGAPGSLFQDSPGKSYAVFGSRGFGFANPNNGLQGTVQDDIINGTQEDDTISGRQGNDKIFGNVGQDVLSGNLNDDYLDGEKGQDILIGGDGNDSLFGGLGNDLLKGDNGNDILTGVDINAINPGIEEIDTLTGGGGSDIFVLGDANNTYYDNLDSDYALITDFNASEDSIQLNGKADDYLLFPFSQGNQNGTAIYRKAAQNELIGILQGGANLSLSGNYFKFVGAG